MTAGTARRRATFALVALFAAVYLAPLGLRPLLLPDEFRYAEIPREMIASGDWVVPRLDGLLYFEKPVLGYWLTGASLRAFGLHRFGVRLPSALAAGLTAALCAWLAARGDGRSRAAPPLAAFVYLTTPLVLALGSLALLDGPLTLFFTATLAFFYRATTAQRGSATERRWLLAAGAAAGLAFLTKGFLALVVPGLVVAIYLAWQRRWIDLVRLPWWPALSATLVALPWSLLVHRRAPGFWPFFFWHEHVQRYLDPVGEQHPSPWWLLFAVTPVLFLPWTVTAPAAVAAWRERGDRGQRDLARFCLAWAATVLVFFSLSKGKLVTYVLPAFPPLAVLVALGLAAPLGERWRSRWRRGSLVGSALLALGALAGVVYLARHDRPVFASPLEAAALPVALAAGAVLLALASRAGGTPRGLALAGFALVPFVLALQLGLPLRISDSKAPGAFLERYAEEVAAREIVVSDSNLVRAASWIYRRDDILVAGSRARELEYGLDHAPQRRIDFEGLRRLIRRRPGRVVVVVGDTPGWREQLPPAAVEHASGGDKGFLIRFY